MIQHRIRYHFLDGVRGIAAIYVALSHAIVPEALETAGAGRPVIKLLYKLFSYGYYSVAVFIVLSGFCLMLPVVKSPNLELSGGLAGFATRRAKRILPPYFAALAIILTGTYLLPPSALHIASYMHPPFTAGEFLSHLFLVHNLNPDWQFRINPPMWSVPPEAQIYILFPLLLLPVARRSGVFGMLLVAILAGLGPHLIWGRRFEYLVPWYFTLFAMGAAAAILSHSDRISLAAWRRLAIFSALMAAIVLFATRGWGWENKQYSDPVIGLSAACLIGFMAATARQGNKPFLLRIFEHKVAVTLGLISYSLYLLHYPALVVLQVVLMKLNMAGLTLALSMLIVGAAVSIMMGCLGYWCFERPWLSGPGRHRRPISAAIIEPAPYNRV